MKITVLLFAGPRELAGVDQVAVKIANGATYGQLRQRLGEEIPSLRPLLAVSRLAAGGQFVDDAEPISENEEIALVPPVSGG